MEGEQSTDWDIPAPGSQVDIIERLNMVEHIASDQEQDKEGSIPSNPDSIRFAKQGRQSLLQYITTCRRQLRANIPTVWIELKLRFSVTVPVVCIEL